jgi:transcriptional regulator with XRE-family HTH domain
MTIGEIIKDYRTEHNMSYEEFAKKCGFSKSYVYALEKNEHPKTKEPIVPSLGIITRISTATNIPVINLCQSLGIAYPGMGYPEAQLSSLEHKLIDSFRRADELDRQMVLRILKIEEKGDAEKMA